MIEKGLSVLKTLTNRERLKSVIRIFSSVGNYFPGRGYLRKFVLFLSLLLVAASIAQKYPLIYHETFENGAQNWQPNFPENWQVIIQDNQYIYELIKPGENTEIRKPTSMSILTPFNVGNCELQVRGQCYSDPGNIYRDLCLFFGYQDENHFYYCHFSSISDGVHNIIAIVNDADRTKINLEPAGTSRALLEGNKWNTLKIERDISSGSIIAYIENEQIMTAIDTTFKKGYVGIGSFDDTGAFTDLSLWGRLIETKIEKSRNRPQNYHLGQNYPNPFNPKTKIEYSIGKDEHVNISIFDINGRQVFSLVDKVQKAGQYVVSFEPKNFSSGIYFYTLKTHDFCDTKKMIFVE